MAARAIVVLPILTVVAHSSYVFNARRKKIQEYSLETPIIEQRAFRPAETNEVISDALQTGDIILFKRRWYLNYVPLAAAIVAYRSVTKSEFDHAGVILVDQMGTTWIVERSFLSGLVCRKFVDRLKYSQSELISLIPLLPRNCNFNNSSNPISPTNVVARIFDEGDDNPSELFILSKFILESILPGNSNEVIGPHVDLLQRFYRLFHITLQVIIDDENANGSYEKVLDLKLVEERRIELKVSQGKKQELQLSRQNINIQTR